MNENITQLGLVRHGQKGGTERGLTEKGIEQAKALGSKIKNNSPDYIAGKHSQTARTERTLRIAAESAEIVPNVVKADWRLAIPYQEDSDIFKRIMSIRKQMTAGMDKSYGVDEAIQNAISTAQMNLWLSLDEAYFEEEKDENNLPKFPSPAQLASLVCQKLLINLKRPSGNGKDQVLSINATHEFNILGFLATYLDKKNVDEIGGPIDETEMIQFEINRTKQTISMEFRGQNYDLDIPKISNIYNTNKDFAWRWERVFNSTK